MWIDLKGLMHDPFCISEPLQAASGRRVGTRRGARSNADTLWGPRHPSSLMPVRVCRRRSRFRRIDDVLQFDESCTGPLHGGTRSVSSASGAARRQGGKGTPRRSRFPPQGRSSVAALPCAVGCRRPEHAERAIHAGSPPPWLRSSRRDPLVRPVLPPRLADHVSSVTVSKRAMSGTASGCLGPPVQGWCGPCSVLHLPKELVVDAHESVSATRQSGEALPERRSQRRKGHLTFRGALRHVGRSWA